MAVRQRTQPAIEAVPGARADDLRTEVRVLVATYLTPADGSRLACRSRHSAGVGLLMLCP